MAATSLILCRFRFCLFERVALLLLSVPLCFEPCLSTPSLCFVQRAAAFRLSFVFARSHTLFSMFMCSFGVFSTCRSCSYILPCFSNFTRCVWASGFDVGPDYVLSFLLFFFVNFFTVMPIWFPNFPAFVCPTPTYKSCSYMLSCFPPIASVVFSKRNWLLGALYFLHP
jgi:hypothetical protein